MNLDNSVIAIIGLGYVGLPLAVEFGKRRAVIGFDIKASRIAELQAGKDSTLEVGHEEFQSAKQLKFTTNPQALQPCGVFIVTVPTPVDKANRPNMAALVGAWPHCRHQRHCLRNNWRAHPPRHLALGVFGWLDCSSAESKSLGDDRHGIYQLRVRRHAYLAGDGNNRHLFVLIASCFASDLDFWRRPDRAFGGGDPR